jgi:uncharacterized protein
MIIETIFSTLDESGKSNFAPMGILWGEDSVIVRPFRTSQTYRNLLSSGHGVANLSDNVLAFVQCALYDEILPGFPAVTVPGVVFQDACSWLELAVVASGGSEDRAEFRCRVLHRGRQKDFLGFCRARNAVIEAAIMATRLVLHDRNRAAEILNQYMKVVEKTGSEIEKQAFQLICEYVGKQGE